MRIMVTSNEGGKDVELLSSKDIDAMQLNGIMRASHGWYYVLLMPAEDKDTNSVSIKGYNPPAGYIPIEPYFNGPFNNLTAAFTDAINANYAGGQERADHGTIIW